MTWHEKWNLQVSYKPNCECSVNTCFGEQGCKSNNKMACGFNFLAPRYANACRTKHQYCRLKSDTQSCAWFETYQYKQCMKRSPWTNGTDASNTINCDVAPPIFISIFLCHKLYTLRKVLNSHKSWWIVTSYYYLGNNNNCSTFKLLWSNYKEQCFGIKC